MKTEKQKMLPVADDDLSRDLAQHRPALGHSDQP
jgi:hypothetical protein